MPRRVLVTVTGTLCTVRHGCVTLGTPGHEKIGGLRKVEKTDEFASKFGPAWLDTVTAGPVTSGFLPTYDVRVVGQTYDIAIS